MTGSVSTSLTPSLSDVVNTFQCAIHPLEVLSPFGSSSLQFLYNVNICHVLKCSEVDIKVVSGPGPFRRIRTFRDPKSIF